MDNISLPKKKRLMADDGNAILSDDEVVRQDMMEGRRILSYGELR